ncbi:chymotrypsin inhibitor Ani s 6-like [Sabethes cyaneus]|uniref:chymotrypsin inhibitor Ani s 6-like n=1 Tax=Sabethes cyaneus TaxID=53552 RepID=UPI00237EA58B|nr:chymotrypsin inhibitor Ani s 6-like [Sabethes cyaneus]
MNHLLALVLLALVCLAATSCSATSLAGTPCATKCSSGTEIITCPTNEVFACCTECEQLTCEKRVSDIQCFRCPDECVCKEGYIRLKEGSHCVKIEECP